MYSQTDLTDLTAFGIFYLISFVVAPVLKIYLDVVWQTKLAVCQPLVAH